MKKIVLVLIAFAILTTAFSQAKLVEKVVRKPGEITIAYEKYILPNGLTVVVHEDHSDPVVHVDVTYHVGSARETPGKSGFAHFFEHMMFQGSKHVGDEQHFKMITEAGGTLNGTTNRDRTNYFETLPKNQLEIALWLEADRMGYLLDSVTQQKFEVQRATVKNERGQNYDNRPYGLVGETTARALYPQGHSYSWLTIGYIDHLNGVDVNDLKQFFLRWYGPNNATLTVGGDVNTQEVVKLAEKYFGPIPAGPEVVKMKPFIPVLNEDRYISMADNIRFPMLQITWPSCEANNADEAPLDILTSILADGKSSLFYQNFIKSQKANTANMYNGTYELSGELVISVRAFPDEKLSDIEALIWNTLNTFETNGITDAGLQRAKAQTESNFIQGIESVGAKVSQLAANQTYTGNPNKIQKELEDYRNVSKEDVMRVYNKYIKGKHYVALSVYPRGKDNLARADTYKIPPPDATAPHVAVTVNYADPKDNFDRSKKPSSGANPVVTTPKYYTMNFPNGCKLIGTQQSEIPVIYMQLNMKGGHLLDATSHGLAAITARMMNEATVKYTAEQFGDELDKIGSKISVNADDENTSVVVSTLSKNLNRTMELFEERIMNPKFEQEAFDRIKKQTLENIANSYTQPVSIASNNWARIIYGTVGNKGIPVSGTLQSVEALTLDEVKKFYNQYYAPDYARLTVAGDATMEIMKSATTFVQNWQRSNYKITPPATTLDYKPNVIYLINKEGAAQSEIRVGYLALPYDALGDYYKCTLMNFQLGGAFNSRINLNLREDKGWTYGARSGFSGTKYAGPYTVSGGFKKEATDSAIVEIFKELKNYSKSITETDIKFTQSSIIQRDALRFETLRQKAGYLNEMDEYDLPADFILQQNKILNNLSVDDMKSIADSRIKPASMYILVVGDKATNMDKLKKLGYDVVELDKDGAVMQ